MMILSLKSCVSYVSDTILVLQMAQQYKFALQRQVLQNGGTKNRAQQYKLALRQRVIILKTICVIVMYVCGGVGVGVTIYTFDDGPAVQECVFLRAQRDSLRHTAAGIPQGGGGFFGGGGEVAGWLG
jgi:hypothetical protein